MSMVCVCIGFEYNILLQLSEMKSKLITGDPTCFLPGNFHRIRCALSYGAQRLGEIFMLPGRDIGVGLEKFFTNTLDQNGKGERRDACVPVPAFGTGISEVSDLSGDYDTYCNSLLHSQWCHNYTLPTPSQPSPPPSPSQIQQKNAGNALSGLRRSKQNIFSKKGRDIFLPRMPLFHPYASQLYAANSGINEMGKSRGTGTYIPNMVYTQFHCFSC